MAQNQKKPICLAERSPVQYSDRVVLKREADTAFSIKQIAFSDWHSARKERNDLRKQLNHCISQIAATEEQLGRERRQRSANIAAIDEAIRAKEAEIRQCRQQSHASFRNANALRKEGDRDEIFARWEGYDLSERCLSLESDILNLQAEREMHLGATGVLPSQAIYDELRAHKAELQDQLRQALAACDALEQVFREKERIYQELQGLYQDATDRIYAASC